MAENDFVVNFGTDDFQVIFGEQGPQGPAAAATPFNIGDVYEQGDIVFDTSGNLFGSRVNDNTGNPLTDTDAWTPLGIASGTVTQLNDLTDVTLSTPTLNQGLIFDGTMWVNKAIPNSTPVNPTQEKTTLSLTQTEIILGSTADDVRASVSINLGFEIDGVEFDVRDQNNHTLPVTNPEPNAVQFTVDTSLRGHVSVTAHVAYTRQIDGTAGSDTVTRSVVIEESYFSSAATLPPAAVTDMVNEGVWSSPKELTQTTQDMNRKYYVALPDDRTPYEFTSGLAIFSATDLGLISLDYRLFELTDFNDDPSGRTFIVDIAEA